MLAAAATILLVGGVIVALIDSQHFSDPRLGPDWQCARAAIFITVCSPLDRLVAQRNP
jgi:hypothetical protein